MMPHYFLSIHGQILEETWLALETPSVQCPEAPWSQDTGECYPSPWPKAPYPVINENWVAWRNSFLDKSILAASYYPAISLEVVANRLLAYLFQSLSGDRNYSDWSAIPWISLGPADLKICNFLAKSHFCSCSFLILVCILIPSSSC